MNRALRAAMTGVLLLSPVMLSACSAGQVTQTATQFRDKSGGQADVGPISLREVRLASPLNGSYQKGSDARLIVAITNTSGTDDTLQSITGPGFQSLTVVPGAQASATTTTAAAPTSAGATSDPDAVDVTIPAGGSVIVGGDGPTITLQGLQESLNAAKSIPLTFTFEKAGQVTVNALVGTSAIDLPRGQAYDFEEGGRAAPTT